MKKLTIILAFATLLASCQKEPTACISAAKTTGTVNETIKFTNCGTDYNGFTWNAPDLSVELVGSDIEKEVSYKFTKAGTFQIDQWVASKNGKKTDETSVSVTIN